MRAECHVTALHSLNGGLYSGCSNRVNFPALEYNTNIFVICIGNHMGLSAIWKNCMAIGQ